MIPVEHLNALFRRLTVARELTDLLVLEVLEYCGKLPFDEIEKKYVLTDLCSGAYWEQAALWVLERSFPSWTLQIEIVARSAKVKLISQGKLPVTVEIVHPRLGAAILLATVKALITLDHWNMDVAIENR